MPEKRARTEQEAVPSTSELVALGAPIELRDGSHVRFRQGQSSDRELLLHGVERLSEESRYRRFLAPTPELSETMVEYLINVDHLDHEAGTIEVELTIPAVGVTPALRKLLQIAARHDVAVPLTGPRWRRLLRERPG